MNEIVEEKIIKIDKVKKPKDCIVTLCMIVKDEEAIIVRCLESMVKYIDRYDITDTGSTDTTKELIKEFFDARGIPAQFMKWNGPDSASPAHSPSKIVRELKRLIVG